MGFLSWVRSAHWSEYAGQAQPRQFCFAPFISHLGTE